MTARKMMILPNSLALALVAMTPLMATQLGCAPTQTMQSANRVPASQGTVKASAADNGNTNLLVKVKHLAPPSRIESDATVYVVWIEPTNAAKQSVGALTLNNNLEGTLETVTPHRRFLVLVTPEPSGQVAQPTHQAVFTSQVDRR